MRFHLRAGMAATTLLLVLSALLAGSRVVNAAGFTPPGPDRFEVITEHYSKAIWWLARWSNSTVACQIEIDHEGLPNGWEVLNACGQVIYDNWITTQACTASASNPASCSGYYLHYVKSEPATRLSARALPPPIVRVTLDGCSPYASSFRCDGVPVLVLTGEEPLENYSITSLGGVLNEKNFTCDPLCQVELGPTSEAGMLITFWAFSSYGDSSEVFEARVRVRSMEDPNDLHWYVDVLSTQWRGGPTASCSLGWDTFPPVGGLTGWLATPESPDGLASNIPYGYLAGNLISHGVVDASSCTDGGLQENGYASTCGTEVARPAVDEWQNRFDKLIYSASREVGVPAQLLKNIFSRESQFWPGVTSLRSEAGLGQMTDNGADTTLLWNRPFFEQFCPTVMNGLGCQEGYPHLLDIQRAALRNALVQKVDAFCSDCPLSIDLDEAEASVVIFAETLAANCAQTGMVVDLNYGYPNPPPNYEDLWRFTLTNYNAGPGCLGLAIDATARTGESLDWEHVSSHFTSVCSGAINYVNDVTSIAP